MSSGRRQTTLITGASSGIGLELASIFAEKGFDLVLVARREDRLRALAERLESAHRVRVTVLPMDLLTDGAPTHLFEAVGRQGIEIDVLVNNAGVLEVGAFREIGLEDQLRLIDLNVRALVALTHLWLAPMLARGGGRILNVASLAAFQPVPSMTVYAAAKAFVLSLTESLSEELRGTGVTLTALCPGLTRTEMADRAKESSEAVRWLPDVLIADVEGVAREGYEACMEGRVVAVPGVPNRLVSTLVGTYPRWLVRRVGGWFGRRAIP
jgi:short-subunit dehydrogenase